MRCDTAVVPLRRVSVPAVWRDSLTCCSEGAGPSRESVSLPEEETHAEGRRGAGINVPAVTGRLVRRGLSPRTCHAPPTPLLPRDATRAPQGSVGRGHSSKLPSAAHYAD